MTFKGETIKAIAVCQMIMSHRDRKTGFLCKCDCFISSTLNLKQEFFLLTLSLKSWFQKINMTPFIWPLGGSQKFWTNAFTLCCNQMSSRKCGWCWSSRKCNPLGYPGSSAASRWICAHCRRDLLLGPRLFPKKLPNKLQSSHLLQNSM